MTNAPKILLTAPPCTGKSTTIKETVRILQEDGLSMAGFFTEEVLDTDGERLGFDLVDVNGSRRAALSRIGLDSEVMVERYGVDLKALGEFLTGIERELAGKEQLDLVVLDEIGNMQLAAPQFARLVQTALDSATALLGSVHVFQHPITDAIKQRLDISLRTLTLENRQSMPIKLAAFLQNRL